VTELFTFLPTAANAANYVEILLEKFKLRQMLALCERTTGRCVDNGADVWQIIQTTASEVADVARANLREKPLSFNQHIAAKLERFQSGTADDDVIYTGLPRLDQLSPVKRGDMPVIAGEAKAGKSMLAVTIAVNMALRGHAIGYSSHEMTASEQTDRILHGAARVPTANNHLTKLREGELQSVERAVQQLGNARIDLRDDFTDISALLAWGRGLKAKWPDLAALFIDYLQLVRGVRHKGDTREMEIAGMSRSLRALAMELRCAVVVLSQLNKDGDTRESMSLEQDTTALWKIALTDTPGTRLITIPRQRNGDSGIGFKVAFLGHIARVENLANDEADDEPAKPQKRTWHQP
jgi:replicative DNA helicase